MTNLRFSHVALNCHDPRAVEEYYTAHFGFRRARAIPVGDSEIVFLRCGDVYLELFNVGEEGSRAEAGSADGPRNSGVRHLAFRVDDVDSHLEAMGSAAELTLGPLDFDDFIPGWRSAWLEDPEGNVVEVSQGYRDADDLQDGAAIADGRQLDHPDSRAVLQPAGGEASGAEFTREDQR